LEPFKNIYSTKEVQKLANELENTYIAFNKIEFLNSILDEDWEEKELKDRMRTITLSLGLYLPKDYRESLKILKKVQYKFNGLFHLVFPDFVELYGLEYYDDSIEALKLFTVNCSSEFAVRPFLIKYPNFIEVFKKWAKDESEHIRRLSSEGCRPRLPWAMALPKYKKDPTKVLEVLELLKSDSSKYVQKSVANNLNDISKDNPKVVKELFKRWHGRSKDTDWIIKHGARTLLKAGDKEVLELFGYFLDGIKVLNFKADTSIKLNEYLNFSFDISSTKLLGKLRVEYKLGFLRQKNKINYKVFKISERDVKENKIEIQKSHHFKEVTTRRYYSGMHTLTIVVNGKEFETKEFKLTL
jgi:3-methyladenine DNA glycosylase AlkC